MPRLRDDCLSSLKAGKEITLSRSSVNIDGRQEAREDCDIIPRDFEVEFWEQRKKQHQCYKAEEK